MSRKPSPAEPSPAPLDVLYEDNHLLIVNKPALLPTMGVAADRPSLLARAKEYIKRKYAKPGNVYLGIVSRLDAPVTGIVVVARTSKAAARLSEQFRKGFVQKTYWALVEGEIRPAEGQLVDYLAHDERHRRMHVVAATHSEAKEARLSYLRRERIAGGSALEVQLETGRKHQIRLQLAHAGHPVWGDRKYGSRRPFPRGIALHARALTLEHPVRREPVSLVAPLPPSWPGPLREA